MANRGLGHNNSVGSVNLFLWMHHETFQRGSLAATVRRQAKVCPNEQEALYLPIQTRRYRVLLSMVFK